MGKESDHPPLKKCVGITAFCITCSKVLYQASVIDQTTGTVASLAAKNHSIFFQTPHEVAVFSGLSDGSKPEHIVIEEHTSSLAF